MKQSIVFVSLFFFLFGFKTSKAQSSFEISGRKQKVRVPFELINNLIVVPVKINGTAFSFILDSGVNKTILFNYQLVSVLQLKNRTAFRLRGFSNAEAIKAVLVEADLFEFDRLKSFNHEILLLEDENLSFSQRMGTQIDGILGASLFRDYKISVNYNSEYIRIEPSNDKAQACRRFSVLPIRFRNGKPLVNASITQENGEIIAGNF